MKKKILLGITGGIAIYKVCDLCSRLIKRGYELDIIMTEAAVKMISPIVFETMGNCRVYYDMFHSGHHEEVEHIELAKRADFFLIAPATGNTIAKINHGVADNLLTSVALAYTKEIHFAVTMNTNMLHNPATQKNIQELKEKGHQFIDSEVGVLACNTVGDGRMAEPEKIAQVIDDYWVEKDLKGRKILVTAGPTQEQIDPVRYLSNYSSGKMGYEIAREGTKRGAEVILITGPTNIEKPDVAKLISIKSTQELYKAVGNHMDVIDTLIMAAAPADYRLKNPAREKIKKNREKFQLELEENPDILAEMGKRKKGQVLIGFAAETNNLIENAKEKLLKKNADYIIANDVTQEGAGFNVDTNIASIVEKNQVTSLEKMSKKELANKILDLLKEG